MEIEGKIEWEQYLSSLVSYYDHVILECGYNFLFMVRISRYLLDYALKTSFRAGHGISTLEVRGRRIRSYEVSSKPA